MVRRCRLGMVLFPLFLFIFAASRFPQSCASTSYFFASNSSSDTEGTEYDDWSTGGDPGMSSLLGRVKAMSITHRERTKTFSPEYLESRYSDGELPVANVQEAKLANLPESNPVNPFNGVRDQIRPMESPEAKLVLPGKPSFTMPQLFGRINRLLNNTQVTDSMIHSVNLIVEEAQALADATKEHPAQCVCRKHVSRHFPLLNNQLSFGSNVRGAPAVSPKSYVNSSSLRPSPSSASRQTPPQEQPAGLGPTLSGFNDEKKSENPAATPPSKPSFVVRLFLPFNPFLSESVLIIVSLMVILVIVGLVALVYYSSKRRRANAIAISTSTPGDVQRIDL